MLARESITSLCCTHNIQNDDVILIFGYSLVINQILLHAATVYHKRFRVIIVDARPLCDGKRTLEVLSPVISCVYTSLSAAGAIMSSESVTRVLLGRL